MYIFVCSWDLNFKLESYVGIAVNGMASGGPRVERVDLPWNRYIPNFVTHKFDIEKNEKVVTKYVETIVFCVVKRATMSIDMTSPADQDSGEQLPTNDPTFKGNIIKKQL